MHLSTRVVEICNFSHHYLPTRVAEPVVLLSACGVKFFFVLRVCTVNIWHERTNPTGSYCCIDIVTCYSRTKQDLYQQQRKCQPCTRRAFMKLHLYLRFCTICRMWFPPRDSALRRWIRCWIPSGILHHQPSGSQGLLTFFKAIKVRTGQVTANAFMSDDAPAFFNVWKDVMREPKHRLLCAWHINKNWREHIPFSGGVHDCVRKF